MTASTHTVIFEKGDQDVTSVAYRDDAEPFVPAAPTYGIVDLRHTDTSSERVIVAAGTVPTQGAISLAVSAAGPAEADPRVITIASIAGLVEGERFLLTDQVGIREVVTIDSLPSATSVQLRTPIARNYLATSLLVSIENTATFPSAEAADEDEVKTGGGPYAIDWDFDGVLRREIIWVRRTSDRTWAAPEDLRLLDQTLEAEIGASFQFWGFIQQAHRDVRDDLRMASIDANRIDGTTMRSIVTYKAAWHGRSQTGDSEKLAKKYDDRYRGLISSVIEGLKPDGTTYTDDDDKADEGTTKVRHSLFSIA